MQHVAGPQFTFETIKKLGKCTRVELQKEWEAAGRNGQVDQNIYALMNKKWIERFKDGDTRYYQVRDGASPVFGRNGRKRKHQELSRRSNTALAAPRVSGTHEALQDMAQAHSAMNTLKSAAAMFRCAEIIDKVGPDQMLMMLSGIDKMTH